MNTATDHLDDQIRTLVRTAALHSGAPSVDDIEHGVGVAVAPATDSRCSFRWIAVAAVLLLALTGALMMISNRESTTTPADVPPPADTRPSLGTYVLPTTTPVGWQLVDISEDAGGVLTPTAALYEIAAREGDDHAILMISPPNDPAGTDPTGSTDTTSSAESVAEPQWAEPQYGANGQLSWIIDGQQAILFVPGPEEALARYLQAHIEALHSENGLALADSPSWRITPIDNATVTPAGSASLMYRDAAGSIIFVSLDRTTPNDIDVLLDPTVVNAPAVVGAPTPYSIVGSLVRDETTVRLFWPASGSSTEGAPIVESFLNSFQVVTRDEWERTDEAIAALIGNQPTIAATDVLDGTLTIHEGATVGGVCFTNESARDCRYGSVGIPEQAGQRFGSASLIVNGAWIYILELGDEESQQPIAVDVPDVPLARADTPIGNFIVLAPPSGVNEISLTIGEGATATTEQAVRPLR